LDIDQKFVGLKMKENNILSVNFRVPGDIKDEIMDYFQRFKIGEPMSFDIGNTGDINCLFKGISPVVSNDDKGYFISITLQEIKAKPQEESEGHECHGCGLH
ncbi:hypothetical protein LJC03_05990, partial [Methanobrevibacter sp. OttesenSCG-928-I08]|nr:hypothetical protein [Methanobrevibacter sp. OttesenSCG-928-I08]